MLFACRTHGGGCRRPLSCSLRWCGRQRRLRVVRALSRCLLGSYALDLLIGAVIINIWEEMAWTGFVQRRAMARWNLLGGSLMTAVLFAGIHVPLSLQGAGTTGEAVYNILILTAVAVGLRLLIARIDTWSGRSLLTIGILHSSFNATENVIEPTHDWIRITLTILVALALLPLGRGSRSAH